MKKYFSVLCAAVLLAGLNGCGDNKTRNKLVGTEMVDANSGSGYTSNPVAASMTALYKASCMGSGAGGFTYSGPRRFGAPSMAPGGEAGAGLGSRNANGEYVTVDSVLGMTVTLAFKKSGNTVYMDFDKAFSQNGLFMYAAQSFSSTQYTLTSGVDPNDIMTALLSASLWIPGVWTYASNGNPVSWYEVTTVKMMSNLSDLSAWMTDSTRFPDSLVNTVTGAIPGGTMNMTMTTAMPSGRPTDASPCSMTGSGTVTFDTGEIWSVTSSMSIGDSGPIGGTQSFTSSDGTTGTLTFNADGSMDGLVASAGATVATMHVNADGTGTFTDTASGQTYSITNARPS